LRPHRKPVKGVLRSLRVTAKNNKHKEYTHNRGNLERKRESQAAQGEATGPAVLGGRPTSVYLID
jgi:hypothetical protein